MFQMLIAFWLWNSQCHQRDSGIMYWGQKLNIQARFSSFNPKSWLKTDSSVLFWNWISMVYAKSEAERDGYNLEDLRGPLTYANSLYSWLLGAFLEIPQHIFQWTVASIKSQKCIGLVEIWTFLKATTSRKRRRK